MAIGLTAEDAAKINRSEPERYIETLDSKPENPTYGSMLEVFHQIHCLNLIRTATWPLNRFDKSWGALYPDDLEEPVGARMHVDHCIEALRLSLMCYADVTPMLIIRDESRALGSFADFNTHHKCRNFDKLVEYVDRTGTDIPATNTTNLDEMEKGAHHAHRRAMARKYAKYAKPAP
ncbi:hypothetical protein Golomagni_05730 [Golovinomyces magnicellulatus]|nr:hypothetical protein Golomagni_05730 [Golovinomyces magnicellulatus]